MARAWTVAAAVSIVGVLGVAAEARPGGRIAAGAPHWRQMMPGVQFAPVYGDWEKGAHGKFVRIDHGTRVPMHGHSNGYDGVVTSGRMANVYGDGQRAELVPGDYFHMPARQPHSHECLSEGGCTFYTHSNGSWDMLAGTDQAGVSSGNTGNSNLGSGTISGKFVRDEAASVPQAEASTHIKAPSDEVGEAGRDHIIIRTDAASSELQGNARAFEGNILHQTNEGVTNVHHNIEPPATGPNVGVVPNIHNFGPLESDESVGSDRNMIDRNKAPSGDGLGASDTVCVPCEDTGQTICCPTN